ncbi:NAD(+)/NADH kinase [Natrinema caseinilyticum]|uniref:NAD(+)/NADH kinase n=1 Tax=Natrinema caseinilyticum TaxID=2961570 RepID=UPI0020C4EC74|nr:NAD(+)/NADH kinase [Natrinema caseinilyticum]
MDAAWSAGEDPVVGIVDSEGDGRDAAEIAESLDAASVDDARIVRGSRETVLAAEPSVLVAVGDASLAAAARAGVETPILPVGPVTGIESIDRDRVPDALAAALDGRAVRRARPVLDVALETRSEREGLSDAHDASSRERALFDVTLVTDEPARISEYGVHGTDATVATFRADGVVVATPAGSNGYASAVGAPRLSAAVDAIAVAPIGPFVTQTRRWVLPDDDLALTVERDEGDVTLVVDGRPVGSVTVDSRIAVAATEPLQTLVVPDEQLADR